MRAYDAYLRAYCVRAYRRNLNLILALLVFLVPSMAMSLNHAQHQRNNTARLGSWLLSSWLLALGSWLLIYCSAGSWILALELWLLALDLGLNLGSRALGSRLLALGSWLLALGILALELLALGS
jgi:hypothetical protein